VTGGQGTALAGTEYRLGVDVGGTFVDFVLTTADGLRFHKQLRSDDPTEAFMRGVTELGWGQGLDRHEFLRRVRLIVHGTTVTTNALITGTGARVGLLTTRGLRDALEMRRGLKEEVYDQKYEPPTPLVPRWRRVPIAARMDSSGREITRLDPEDVRAASRQLGEENVDAIAICFLHAYLNPRHEEVAAAVIQTEMPGAFLSISSRLVPQLGFYERLSTTVLNAYVGPLLDRYLSALMGRLREDGFAGTLLIVNSAGGVVSADAARARPVETIGSGPAAGPAAAVRFARAQGYQDCTVVDMGGTSFDSAVVLGGHPITVTRGVVERRAVAIPMVGVHSVGAGGGSIVWVDPAGVLRVGPESAGANPGPACYGLGGKRPTCTDADLLLGYLNPDYFLGGRLRLDPTAAEDAMRRELGEWGANPLETAAGAFQVVNASMAAGLRTVTLERGIDTRTLPMVVAGGAGPVHAAAIAQDMAVPVVLVPRAAATFCALGTLFLDYRHELVRSHLATLGAVDPARLIALFAELTEAGRQLLHAEGVPPQAQRLEYAADLRYARQFRSLTVPLAEQDAMRWDVGSIEARFHARHEALHGYATRGSTVEVVNVRVSAVGEVTGPPLPALAPSRDVPEPSGTRLAYDHEHGRLCATPVYPGEGLTYGQRLSGPALIDLPSTTIVVPAAYRVLVDRLGTFALFTPDVEDGVAGRVLP
jgi:N-methylhydantoinase A